MDKFLAIVFLLITYGSYAQDLHFSDSLFLKAVLNHTPSIDLNGDGKIQQEEAHQVRELNLMRQQLKSVDDVYLFPNVKKLFASYNEIESVKLENLDSLEALYLAQNKLTLLELRNLPMLNHLGCGTNTLKEISLENLPNLESITCMDNKLKEIDVRPYTKLKYLTIDSNQLKQLDISQNKKLIQVIAHNNDFETLDIRANSNLKVNILYIDDDVKLIGTPEQLKIPLPGANSGFTTN